MSDIPLVIAVLHSDADDKRYQLYCAAYGIEMQIDNEWNAELVLLAPCEHLSAVTEDTDVTGEDAAIVSAGVTDVPLTRGGTPDLSAIEHDRNNWLLIAGPGNTDSESTIKTKLHGALEAGCRAILCFSESGQLATRLQGLDAAALPRLVLAYIGPDAERPAAAKQALESAQELLRSTLRSSEGCRFVVGGNVNATNAAALTAVPHVSGVLLEEKQYNGFSDILEILAALGESESD
jgi:hypothetical protein